jgi:hypothetical protein
VLNLTQVERLEMEPGWGGGFSHKSLVQMFPPPLDKGNRLIPLPPPQHVAAAGYIRAGRG